MPLFATKKSLILWAFALFVSLAMFYGLLFYVSVRDEHRLTADPLSLSSMTDIRKASVILIETALSGDESSSEAREKLKAMMLKLRDGWIGIIDDSRGPNPYRGKNTAQRVLGTLHWEFAKRVTQDDVTNREEMLMLLHEMRPVPETDEWGGYRYALVVRGLERLLREEE
ncbi:MAG: hypothetical protein O7G85_01270 [Planctomycetota bacterium]|nr:hypothetical protein [Planctomycetota bacterium]